MNPNAKLEPLSRPVANFEVLNGGEQMERQRGNFSGMAISVAERKSADNHVRVPDGLHLVDVVVADDRVEACVQVVQQVHDL